MNATPPQRTAPITADDHPPGCQVLNLHSAAGGAARVIGRIVAPSDPANDVGCEHVSQVIRYPTTGLALPGQESPVGVLVWCEHHGEVGNGMDAVTDEERLWGWHTPSQV